MYIGMLNFVELILYRTSCIARVSLLVSPIDRNRCIIRKCRRRLLCWNSRTICRRLEQRENFSNDRHTSHVTLTVNDSYHSWWRMHEIVVRFIAQFRRKYGLQCAALTNLNLSSESKIHYINSNLFKMFEDLCLLISSAEIYINNY